jgi:MoxR-like ATPase
MAEGRVTVDGHTRDLPQPHLVLATQNPREFHGTFPLPESQLDRFLLRTSVGYLQPEAEMDLIARHGAPQQLPPPAADAQIVQALIDAAEKVHVAREVLQYLHALVAATRQHRALELGLSTRAAIGFYRAVQARALVQGRTFATPDDIQTLFLPVANHRVVLSGLTGPSGERTAVEAVLHQVLESVPTPA